MKLPLLFLALFALAACERATVPMPIAAATPDPKIAEKEKAREEHATRTFYAGIQESQKISDQNKLSDNPYTHRPFFYYDIKPSDSLLYRYEATVYVVDHEASALLTFGYSRKAGHWSFLRRTGDPKVSAAALDSHVSIASMNDKLR